MIGSLLPVARAQDAVELEPMQVTGEAGADERRTLLQSTAVLSGEELRVKTGATIGETLGGELGVHNSSFGPSVGLPVLRGLSGSRVRVMQDGIASHDASTVSPDHASTVEAVLAEQVTVIRGPATLLYGSGASGGAVNVIDNRIPDALPPKGFAAVFKPRYATNADRRSVSGLAEGSVGPIATHVDGFYRKQDDLEIPNEAIDEDAVREQFGLEIQRNSDGTVPNTDAEAYGVTGGASWIGSWGFAGAAVNYLDNEYGLPPDGSSEPSGGGDHSHGGSVRIDLDQVRIDGKAKVHAPFAGIASVELRSGYVDYEHIEVVEGIRGTLFDNEAIEGRVELDHTPAAVGSGELRGTIGGQIVERDFSAIGEEAFIPQSDISVLGAFGVESWVAGRWTLELGLRAEHQRVEQEEPVNINGVLIDRTPIKHMSYSAAAAASADIDRSSRVRFSVSRALRAPDVQELLSFGPHFATRTFDIGDPKLDAEKFLNFDLGIEVQTIYADIGVNLFYNHVRDFIYQRNTGFFFDAEDGQFRVQCVTLDLCLPIYEYTQESAVLKGYELELELPVRETDFGDVYMSLFSDYVRGTLEDSNTDIPRMPPLRFGGQLTFEAPHWRASMRLTRVADQDNPGENETPTDGYTLLNASLRHTFAGPGNEEWTAFVRGTNLLDREIRNAVSFLRNFSPEAGRSIEFGVRVQF